MSRKISKLTKQQQSDIDALFTGVLDEQTIQHDDEDIRAAVRGMWRFMGHEPQAVIVADSPISGAILLNTLARSKECDDWRSLDSSLGSSLYSSLDSALDSALGSSLRSSLRSSLYSSLNSALNSSLYSALSSSLRSALSSSRNSALSSSLNSALGSSLYSALYSSLRSALSSSRNSALSSSLDSALGSSLRSSSYVSVWWRFWDAFYRAGMIAGVTYDQEKYDLFRNWNRHVWHVFANPVIPIASRNPETIHWNAERTLLHCDGGPSIRFRDGWSIWNLNGVLVPQWLAETPSEQLDCRQVLQLENVEQRREGVRKVGAERLLYKLGGKVLDARPPVYELVQVDLGLRIPATALKMANPSVPEVWHVEFVSPECRTVQEALNFRNGLTAEQIDDANGADWIQQGDVILRPKGATKFKSLPSQLT